MAKKKKTPLASALLLVDSLSAEETQTLSDYLRGKLPQTPRKTTAKKAGKAKCAVPGCGLSEDASAHAPESDHYHPFHAVVKQKPGTNAENKVQVATA